jgi:hypothetical protein
MKISWKNVSLPTWGAIACLAVLLGSALSPSRASGQATPAGYWEGTATIKDIPKKTPNMTMTRDVTAEVWFTVEWDQTRNIGLVSGEADAVYDAKLTVDNLPKVTAPVPGGSVKFEPNVGGKLTDTDNRRKFPIYGVLMMDVGLGKGTLDLRKGSAGDSRSESERLDDEAKGKSGPDAPMEFTLRADPGVSGGLSGAAGSVNASADGTVTASAGGLEQGANVGGGGAVIVKKIPMTPFSPFNDRPGHVEKRRGGPFVASFERKLDDYTARWNVKQVGGEQRELSELSPEVRKQIEDLVKELNRR